MKDLIIGSHLWFARASGTVTSTALPAFPGSTGTPWKKLGSVEQWQSQIEKTEVKRRAPRTGGGKYGLRKKFMLTSTLKHSFSLQEFTPLEFELLFNAASIDGAGEFVPNSRSEDIEGWIHMEAYDQADDKIISCDCWAALSIESYQFAEKLDPHTLVVEVLNSTLNAGILTNLT